MLPLSLAVPKELLPLGPKPALQWVAEELAGAGMREIVLVTSPAKSSIGRMFEAGQSGSADDERISRHNTAGWGASPIHQQVRFRTILQQRQLGLGHAVWCAKDSLSPGPFAVALGDCVLGLAGETATLARMKQLYEEESADAVIAFQQVPAERVSRYGIAAPADPPGIRTLDEATGRRSCFLLQDLVEKPRLESAPSRWAVAGRYLLPQRILDLLERTAPDASGEMQLTTAISQLIRDGGKVLGLTLLPGEERFDVGNYRTWTEAFIRFACQMDPTLTDWLRSRIHADPAPDRNHG